MKRLFLYISIVFLFSACGSKTPLPEQVSETNHTDDTHNESNTHHDDDPDDEPAASDNSAETYAFQKDRYTYKNGHIVLTWKELAKVTFEEDYNEDFEEYIFRPIFSDTLKALNGKKVMVEGFVIPIEETGDETFIVLSGLPYLQCFFCGGAGPETVIDILTKNKLKKRLTTDQKITFKGKLRLNADDLDYLNYILDDAELVN